ncbi:MAG: aldo/keto reductase [Alkaliphilus sp.]|nr:MAG: aldo/keto reductase [Alkaliphilus sp.]
MNKRKLGSTNWQVGVVGFGGIPIQRLEEREAIDLIRLAIEEGMDFIDTARAYENSEELIGKAIQGYRYNLFIATKSMAKEYESMKNEIILSLKKLDVDTIDLYQTHLVKTKEQYDRIMSEDGAYRALEEAKEQGLIKEIGLTTHSLDILEIAIESGKFATVQFPYNVIERQAEELFKRAYEKNIGVIIMKPLAGGALNEGDLALKFILENPHISVIIPGMDKMEQVYENAGVGKYTIPLRQEEREKLEELAKVLGQKFCRRCGYCLPCPQNIDIPTNLLFEAYYTRYDLKDWAKDRYSTLPHTASECIKCGVCEKRCPYDLPIIEMLEDVASVLEG